MALTKAQLVDMNANELILDLDADTSLHASTDDQIDIKIGGADDFTFTANTFTALAGSSIVVPASGLTIGSTAVTSTAAELNLIDGGASTGTTAVADADGIITNDGGTMRLTTAATFKTYFQEGISTAYDDLTAGDAAVNITTSSGNITIDAAANDSDIIFKGTDNSADITMLTLDGSAAGDATFNNQIIVGDGKLVLNSTAVTSTAAELNLLDGVSGLVQADLTKLAALDATAAEINFIDGGATIGTTAVADADGIIHNDGGTMKVTTAATFKTYFQEGISQAYDDFTIGDAAVLITTSSGNITVDAAANDSDIILKGTDGGVDTTFLTIDGSAAGDATFNNQIIVGDGKLVLGSTAVTSTAAELNLLDNVSGLVQADLTKLAAIDSTAAEINLIDGGTARGTTAVATGDGILINDGGTMRMTNVDTVSTYFAGHNVGGGNIVTTGALDSGSITSGFGAIDNGTSNIRSATITAETAFVPDAANGATLGTASLEFADMYLHDGGVVYFGADQDVELTHVADAGLSLKTATTSDDTKATLTLQTGDTDIAVNDVLGQIHFQAPDEGAGTDAILVAAGIAAISEGDFSASNNATKLSFQTGASEAASERMSISSTGATIITVADNSDTLTLRSTDADANAGPVLALHRDSGSPADNDIIGRIDFIGDNDAGETVDYISILGKPTDITDGTEDANLIILGKKAGTETVLASIGEAITVFNEDSADIDFRIESNGNDGMFFVDGGNNRVGVGTGTPGGDFEVKLATNVRFVVDDTQDSQVTLKAIQDNGTKNAMRIVCDNLNVETNTGSNTNINRLKVAADGEVVINDDGAETGATVFKVKGALNNTPAIFEHRNSSGSQTMILFRDGAIDTCGTIGIAPASNSVSYNTSSDYRLKENVDYDFDATSRLKQLKPARFNWIKDEYKYFGRWIFST